jgi:hypothetical protein
MQVRQLVSQTKVPEQRAMAGEQGVLVVGTYTALVAGHVQTVEAAGLTKPPLL